MFLVLLYFFAGSALVQSGIFQDEKFMSKFANQWPKFLCLYLIFAASYMYYVVAYQDDAFNESIRRIATLNDDWINAFPHIWPLLPEYAPPILLRTTLHGFLCLSQVLLLVAIFKKFIFTPTPWWTSLARNGFAIFLVHETIVVWSQYWLLEVNISVYFKFLITAIIGISLAWMISAKILLKVPIIERILSPKPREYR